MEQTQANSGESTEASFLDALVGDLRPTPRAPSWTHAVLMWLGPAATFVALALLLTGPARPGVVSDLATLRFMIELALGAAAVIAFIAAGLELGVPGAPARSRLLAPSVILGGAWFALTMLSGEQAAHFSLEGPAVSMAGKRAHCFIEGLLIASPPALFALTLLRRRSHFAEPLAGALVGMAAASLPAIGMQMVCIYDPGHALRFHFGPVLLIGIASAVLIRVTLPRE